MIAILNKINSFAHRCIGLFTISCQPHDSVKFHRRKYRLWVICCCLQKLWLNTLFNNYTRKYGKLHQLCTDLVSNTSFDWKIYPKGWCFVKIWIFFFVCKVTAFVSNRLHTFQHFFLLRQVKSIIDEHPLDSLLYNLDDSRNKTGCFFSSTNTALWRCYWFRWSNWLSCMRCSFIHRFSKIAHVLIYILLLVVKWKNYDDVFIINVEIKSNKFSLYEWISKERR